MSQELHLPGFILSASYVVHTKYYYLPFWAERWKVGPREVKSSGSQLAKGGGALIWGSLTAGHSLSCDYECRHIVREACTH